jgi:hypothetical protein
MSDFEYQRTLIIGVIIGASICILGFSMMRPTQPVEAPETPKSNFTVIEQYKGCDVVQWHYGMLAEYKYFLDCTNSMRNK